MDERARGGGPAGVVAVGLAGAGIGGAVLTSPSFGFARNALSDLGYSGTAAGTPVTAVLFNGGLILAGVVGLGFAGALWLRGPLADRIGSLVLGASLLGLAGVGLFPSPEPQHVPAAVTFYLGSMVAMAVVGVGEAVAGAGRRAALTLAMVAVHVGGWWWWISGGPVTRGGLAIPETLGAILVAAWVVRTARSVSDATTGPNS